MNVTAGCFELGEAKLSPRTTEQELLRAVPTARPLILNGVYHSYSLPPAMLDHLRVLPTVWFVASRIAELHLSIEEEDDVDPAGRSAASGQSAKARHDRWLRDKIGAEPPYDYPWGGIIVDYDKQTGTSAIIVDYRDG